MKSFYIAAVMFAATLLPAAAGAQNFPVKPIVLVMPYTPGSSSDNEARIYQEGLGEHFKQQLVIDYKPGASNMIATSYVARQKPDGYNLLYTVATSAILPAFKPDLDVDLLKDLAPVTLTTKRTFVLVANPGLPANNLPEYVAYAKANPGKVTWSSVGPGGALHMSGEWLAAGFGINLLFVHYKGSAAAEVDLLGGRIDSSPKALISALPITKAGKVKVIAIITKDRSPLLPGVKTVAEQGMPSYEYPGWIGIMTTGGTPAPIVNQLSVAFKAAITTPKAMKGWETQGTTPVGSTPDEFRKQLVAEMAVWKKLVKDNNIKAED